MPFDLGPPRPLALYVEKSWQLNCVCEAPGCGHKGVLMPDDLAAMPEGWTTGDLAERLRCSACGGDVGRGGPSQAYARPEQKAFRT